MSTYDVSEASFLVDLPPTTVRGWRMREALPFGILTPTRRLRFDIRGVRILAIMKALTSHGVSPNTAARHAAQIVDRAGRHGLVAVFSRDPNTSPMLVPVDHLTGASMATIMIPLAPLWAEITIRIKNLKGNQ